MHKLFEPRGQVERSTAQHGPAELDGEVEAASARIYAIPGKELSRAERAADDDGLAIIGVFHSHTHSEPYPSPTDVAQAPDPEWHYVIVSLKREAPETRSYRIVDGAIASEPVAVG